MKHRPLLSTLRRLMLAGFILFTLSPIALLSGCKKKPQPMVLLREWTANAEFGGDVWAADLSGMGQPLEVREGSELVDPIKEVRSGRASFGVASADRVLRENEGGAGLVVLATATYKTPVVLLSHLDQHITKPSDLRGHSVGIQTGTNTELVLKSLLHAQHISPKKLKIVDSGWGTSTFETRDIDVLAAFDYDEPVLLTQKGVSFAILRPDEYGVRYVGTVYFASRDLANKHPEIVQAFMNRIVEGWRQALAHPDEAIEKVNRRFPQAHLDVKKEEQSFLRGRPYFSGEDGHLLYASPDRWESMGSDLVALKLLRSFSFDANVDYSFLEKALHAGGTSDSTAQ